MREDWDAVLPSILSQWPAFSIKLQLRDCISMSIRSGRANAPCEAGGRENILPHTYASIYVLICKHVTHYSDVRLDYPTGKLNTSFLIRRG